MRNKKHATGHEFDKLSMGTATHNWLISKAESSNMFPTISNNFQHQSNVHISKVNGVNSKQIKITRC